MASPVKTIIQYVVIFSITGLLIWFSLRGLQDIESPTGSKQDTWSYLNNAWNIADKGWLILMAGIAIASHVVRAQRWRMLMEPAGHRSKLNYTFYSLMVGYLVNLAIPRGGEVSRCYNLYKIDETPVETSFGTVVTERIIDVLCLLTLIAISFFLESKKLFAFISSLPIKIDGDNSKLKLLIIAVVIIIVLGLGAYFFIQKNNKLKSFFSRTIAGFKEGLLSVFHLKNKVAFISASLLIWLLYFFMSYAVIQAFPATSELGINAVLSLFAIGAIAMAAPLPGGTGSYHVLVPQGLVFLYHIPQADAVAFTFIFHGWQTVIMVFGGGLSLLITTFLVKKKAQEKKAIV